MIAGLVPTPCRVTDVQHENAEASTLRIDAGNVGTSQPGQFNMLYPFGLGEAAISISGSSPRGIEHTVRSVGPVSSALRRLKPGDWVGVRGPFGRPWPIDQERGGDVIVVAGGIGLAPLRPVVRAILADRSAFGRLLVVYGARTPEDRLYASELNTWEADPDIDLITTVDYAGPDWNGRVGFVTSALTGLRVNSDRTCAMTCGPEVMMRHVAGILLSQGIDPSRLFLSMERNMKCANGTCGHCQFGPHFVCRDGPVFTYSEIAQLLAIREI